MQPICKISHHAALLTCVSNFLGVGPGHSAVVIDDHVFTFERVIGAWRVSNSSGWLQIKTRDYLKINTHRPVVVQELSTGKTDATAIYEYISLSDSKDEDYLSSGVCSQQAARALSAGLGLNINPWGFNTPHAIYMGVKQSGVVSKSYHTFPERGAYHFYAKNQLHNWYRPECEIHLDPPPVLSW